MRNISSCAKAESSPMPLPSLFDPSPHAHNHSFLEFSRLVSVPPTRFSLRQRHLMQYKARLEECLAEAKVSAGLSKDASNESLLPKSARRHIFPRYVWRDQGARQGSVGGAECGRFACSIRVDFSACVFLLKEKNAMEGGRVFGCCWLEPCWYTVALVSFEAPLPARYTAKYANLTVLGGKLQGGPHAVRVTPRPTCR